MNSASGVTQTSRAPRNMVQDEAQTPRMSTWRTCSTRCANCSTNPPGLKWMIKAIAAALSTGRLQKKKAALGGLTFPRLGLRGLCPLLSQRQPEQENVNRAHRGGWIGDAGTKPRSRLTGGEGE